MCLTVAYLEIKGAMLRFFNSRGSSWDMQGADRFYLGYPGIGLIKLATGGFFLIGHVREGVALSICSLCPGQRGSKQLARRVVAVRIQ